MPVSALRSYCRQHKLTPMPLVFLVSAALTACGGGSSDSNDNTTNTTLTVQVALADNQQVLPSISTGATGSATLTLNTDTGEISGSVTTTGITSNLSGAHIHEAYAGKNGNVIVPLNIDNSDKSASIPPGQMLTADQITKLRSGQYYLNVHSDDHNGGEIRGQILTDNVSMVITSVDATQANVAGTNTDGTSAGSGTAYTTVDADTSLLVGILHLEGITPSGPTTGVHIHTPGLIDLEDPDTNDIWEGNANLTPQQLTDFELGNFYYNVHTTMWPGGEIRGNITP